MLEKKREKINGARNSDKKKALSAFEI